MASWYLRIMTNAEKTKHDYECPTLILGVWAQIIPSELLGWSIMRAKAAIAKAVELGYMSGGPLVN